MVNNIFQSIFKGKVVIVGIGNTLRGDDGFGPALIGNLQGKVQAVCIDVGSAPEKYVNKITQERPNTILIVDALHLDREPGAYEILQKDDIIQSGLSTHDISIKMFIDYLQTQTQSRIYILGIQPEAVAFGQGLSVRVKRTLDKIEELIINARDAFN
ncbi:MAG: hydrogenase maturation peptidase HycI [Candidatus Omnitrophica bacterium]|nr:hydrogenase maturation peptidase HycI [Candidatus Omnitrophota bacterium]